MERLREPFINLWFGHFFEPAYNNKKFCDTALDEIKCLGFNHVQLDAKAWRDFDDRYKDDKASQYVEMLEYLIGLNMDREFFVGMYMGRFMYNDIYASMTPSEIIGSAVGSGAKGYSVYGYFGLDDGGIIHKMSTSFKESLKVGNEWARRVIPKLGILVKNSVAILYPSSMVLIESYAISHNEERRIDFTGYYKAICDCGTIPDIISLCRIEEGLLSEYRTLIIPSNICYKFDRNVRAENFIEKWIKSGGTIIHGPSDQWYIG